MSKKYYKVNVDHPTKTVTIHGPESPYGPSQESFLKQRESSVNFELDGGWFTGLSIDQAEEIATNYERKGYIVKRYKI